MYTAELYLCAVRVACVDQCGVQSTTSTVHLTPLSLSHSTQSLWCAKDSTSSISCVLDYDIEYAFMNPIYLHAHGGARRGSDKNAVAVPPDPKNSTLQRQSRDARPSGAARNRLGFVDRTGCARALRITRAVLVRASCALAGSLL